MSAMIKVLAIQDTAQLMWYLLLSAFDLAGKDGIDGQFVK